MAYEEVQMNGCQSVPPDILSDLPENVIDSILMSLPLRDAMRTSVLSKKWRYKWCKLPGLTLDQTLWEQSTLSICPALKLAEILCHLLMHHEGPITNFSLSILDLERCGIIDSLIYFLSRNGIQHLVLELLCFFQYKLPSSFFSCLQLRHLTLKGCLMCPPLTFKGFDRLISLELRGVIICSNFLESFISQSPLLQDLVLEIPETLSDIQIIAPNLKSLDFTGNSNSISLKTNTPLLAKLSLDNSHLSMEPGKCGPAKFFESFPALTYLQLDHFSLGPLFAGSGEVPKQLPYALNYLRQLYLYEYCIDPSAFLHVLCLIRSSLHLQEIEIQIYDEDFYSESDEVLAVGSLGVECFSDMTLDHLRAIKLKGITGTEHEMALIKLLLAKSPVLVRMLIEPGQQNMSLEERFEVLVELTKFPRASPKAEVVYKVT